MRHRSAVRLLLAAHTQSSTGSKTVTNEQTFSPHSLRLFDEKLRCAFNSVHGDNYANKMKSRKYPSSTINDVAIFSCGEGIEIINSDINKQSS